MAQINPEPNYDHRLMEWVILYLQTRDPDIFPFTRNFDAEQQRAFIHDLRVGLSDLQNSGSARKTAAVGYIMTDKVLEEILRRWEAAGGDWPETSSPENPDGIVSLVSDHD